MGDILGSIFNFFGDVGGFLARLTQLWVWLQGVLQSIAKVFQALWQFLVKHIIGGIINALRAAHRWLECHLSDVVDSLKRLQQTLQRWFTQYIQPMLVWMQRVRAYLHILALLHIKIAQKLDNYLGKLQGTLITAFYTLTASINTLTQILLALQDPEYLIKHPVLLLSIRRQIPMLIQALTGRPPGYYFPSPRGAAGGVFAPASIPFAATSSLLGNDGLPADLAPYANCYEYADTSVDAVQPLDYFNAELYPQTICPYDDPAKCLLWSWGFDVE